jgi:quaternary ammonium compound-resistance protein SugE
MYNPANRCLVSDGHNMAESHMVWFALVTAGIFEIVWAFALKESHGFTRVGPSILAISGLVLSLALLAYAMRSLPLSVAYLTWTGIGAAGSFLVGVVLLGESASLLRVTAAGLVIAGVVLMKLSCPS